jgi:hypothetical protein
VATANRPAKELEDELAFLQSEYEQHMKIHRVKAGYGSLETIVVTGAEVVENLFKLKWSSAAKALFSLSKRQVDLLEAERAAPGRHLAYIVEAQRRFG